MAQQLGQVAVGTLVKLNENGSPVEFYVAKHDYESGLNGAGRTLLVRKDVYEQLRWNNSSINTYASSEVDNLLNSTYKSVLDGEVLMQSDLGLHENPIYSRKWKLGGWDAGEGCFSIISHRTGKEQNYVC